MESLADVSLTLVESAQDVADMFSWLNKSRDWLGFDIETTGTNSGRDRIRLAQIGDREHGWAAPVEAWGWGAAIAEALEKYQGRVCMHNSIFDATFMARDGFKIPQRQVHDTMVMAQLVTSHLPIGLKPVAARLVDQKAVAGQEVLHEAMKKQGWTWETVPIDFPGYWQYGALDPVLTCRIAEKLWPKVEANYLRSYEIELGAISVLRDARITGMRVDVPYAQTQSADLELKMAALQPELPKKADGSFVNPNSDKQVESYLLSRGAVLIKRTESDKAFSVDDEVLAYLEPQFPECAQMRTYRYYSKLKSSYFDNLLRLECGGIVHPDMRVLGAHKTGRMSITSPALQTLPKSAIGRNAFIARDGCTIISADFQGIEMRLLAHMADELKMQELYHAGIDVHTWTAQQIFETSEPTKKQRGTAKASGFAKIYGAGVPKFAITAGLPLEEAERFLTRYDQLFPRVAVFQEEVMDDVRNSDDNKSWGFVHTEFGRKLRVPKDAAYKGVNYRDQGSAGEVLKMKLCELANAGLGEYIRLPIHDEIIFEVPDELVPEVGMTIHEVMPERDLFKVPLEIDMEVCRRWGDLYD